MANRCFNRTPTHSTRRSFNGILKSPAKLRWSREAFRDEESPTKVGQEVLAPKVPVFLSTGAV